MNLHNALNQCRTARRHGKISSEVQQRTLRRLLRGNQDAPEVITLRRWGSLMALRAAIERDVAPKLEELRKARWAVLRFKDYAPAPEGRQEWGKRTQAPPPIDPTLTPEWWRAAEKRERATA